MSMDKKLTSAVYAAVEKAYDHRCDIEDAADEILEIIKADRKRRGEPVAWRWKWKDLPDAGWQLSSVGGWRETDAIRAEPLYLAPIAPQPALDAADLAFIADELRQAGKNRAADLVLTAMAYPTQPYEPVKVPSDDEIIELRSEFDWREHYGNIRFARALLARYGQPAEPVKVPSDADAKHIQDFIACDGMGAVIVEGPQYSAVVRALLARYGKGTP